MGPWLEQKFQQMIQNCVPGVSGLKMTKLNKTKEFSVTAIPFQLRNYLSLENGGARIDPQEGRSVRLLFAHVFTPEEEAAFKIDTGQFYLSNVEDGVPAFLSIPDVNGAAYNHTCATAMRSALEMNAGYTIPVASLKGGFNGDYTGSTSYSLTLVDGTFMSPILASYESDSLAGLRPFHAAMTIFSWYQEHPERIAAKNRLLAELTGTAVYQQAGMKRAVDLGASAEFKAAFLSIISGSGSASAKANAVSDFQAQTFSVAIAADDAGKRRANFKDLPALSDAISRAEEHGTVVREGEGDDLTLYNRDAKTLWFAVSQLPQKLCTNLWRVEQSSSSAMNATVARAGAPAIFIGKDGFPGCKIGVRVVPSPDMPMSTAQELDLLFILPMSGAQSNNVKLAADRVTFPAFDRPHLSPIATPIQPSVASKLTTGTAVTSNLEWVLQYQLHDRQDNRTAMFVNAEPLRVKCTGNPFLPTRSATIRETGQGSRVVELRLMIPWSGDFDLAGNQISYDSCSIEGSISYTLKNGQTAERPFPTTRIELPVRASHSTSTP